MNDKYVSKCSYYPEEKGRDESLDHKSQKYGKRNKWD